MNQISRLMQSYREYIAIPWRADAASAQRVIFCVYEPSAELRLRAKISEFEIATREADHEWAVFDLTDTFARWLGAQKYAKSYFERPDLLATAMPKYAEFIAEEFQAFLRRNEVGESFVVALKGVGSLFSLLKVKDVVDKLSPMVEGRLVVFFPGSYEDNNYRLFDAYDGWNYLAVPITADKAF